MAVCDRLEMRDCIRTAWAPAQEGLEVTLLRLVKERLSTLGGNDDDLGTASGPLVTRMEDRNGLIDPVVQNETAQMNAEPQDEFGMLERWSGMSIATAAQADAVRKGQAS